MKTILVPTDFSPEAENALKAAVQLAKKLDAQIKLMHIIEYPYSGGFNSSGTVVEKSSEEDLYVMKLAERAKKKLEDLAYVVYNEVSIAPIIRVGSVFKNISDHLTGENIDLIVMGTKGASGLQEFFIGSNTQKVMKGAACPVLTIKETTSELNINDILVATDFATFSPKFIELLNNWKKVLGSKIHLLMVNTPAGFMSSSQSLETLERFLQKYELDIDSFEVYNAYTEVEGISEYTKDIKADLIAMVTHGREGLSKFMSGSVTDEVIAAVNVPVLTIKFNEKEL